MGTWYGGSPPTGRSRSGYHFDHLMSCPVSSTATASYFFEDQGDGSRSCERLGALVG